MIHHEHNLSEFDVSCPNRVKKLDKFLVDISDKVYESIYSECLSGNRIFETMESMDGCVEIDMKSDGMVCVKVIHFENEHTSPLLESIIQKSLPDWWEVHETAEKEARKEKEFQDYLWRNSRYW